MDEARVGAYIASVRWQFDKTMPQNPHEYTVRKWNPALEDEFVWLVETLREHGVPTKFYGKTYMYYHLDGKVYWSMGAPIDETILINRADMSLPQAA